MKAQISCSDKELIIRLHQGDVAAFDALYWKYHLGLYRNIFKLTKDTDATQNILQEVFITLWEKRLTIDPDQWVANWLFVVSYNKSISYLKKITKESLLVKELEVSMQSVDEEENFREDQLALLEEAVNQLSPQKRKVFDLCKIQGRTYEETAKELNISKHTVKEYLSAAIINLKEYIKQHPQNNKAYLHAIFILQFFLKK